MTQKKRNSSESETTEDLVLPFVVLFDEMKPSKWTTGFENVSPSLSSRENDKHKQQQTSKSIALSCGSSPIIFACAHPAWFVVERPIYWTGHSLRIGSFGKIWCGSGSYGSVGHLISSRYPDEIYVIPTSSSPKKEKRS